MLNRFNQFLEKHPKWQQHDGELIALVEYLKDGGPNTYLEIGTAEGGSLYFLAPLLNIVDATCVDFGEEKTALIREWVFDELADDTSIRLYAGHSADPAIVEHVQRRGPYDIVMIDAGHKYKDVLADWINYGGLARKSVIFHDIQMPDVRKVWDSIPNKGNKKEIVFSDTFGFGVLRVNG